MFLAWQYNHLNTVSLGLLAHFSLSMLGACWQLHLSTITEPRPDSTRGACAEAAVLLLLGLLLEPDLSRETQKTSKFTSLHLKHLKLLRNLENHPTPISYFQNFQNHCSFAFILGGQRMGSQFCQDLDRLIQITHNRIKETFTKLPPYKIFSKH